MRPMTHTHALRSVYAGACVAVALAVGTCLRAASIPEPPTLAYGRVVHLVSGREFLATEGVLTWTLRTVGSDAETVVLTANLQSLGDGAFSYRMAIPHEARVLDATTSDGVVPLRTQQTVSEIVSVDLDGVPARFANLAHAFLAFSQNDRARAYRIDIIASGEMPDADGDGMPDVWEDAAGLDKQRNDAAEDADGDGLSNFAEFQSGSDPQADNRIPSLLTSDCTVYDRAGTGLILKSLDTDSQPQARVYTIAAAPAGGALTLRRDQGLRQLNTGDSFSQADVDNAALVFEHTDSEVVLTEFTVILTDENPEHQSAPATVELTVYKPTAAQAAAQNWPGDWLTQQPSSIEALLTGTAALAGDQRIPVLNWMAANWWQQTVWDASASGQALELTVDEKAIVTGSQADDMLQGGDGDDILAGGPGADTLTGGAGRDIFIVDTQAGHDTITDFSLADADCLDLSALVRGASADIRDYLVATASPDGVTLAVDADGDGSGYTDASVTLLGLDGDQADVQQLYADGRILAPGLQLPTIVSVSVAEGDGVGEETESRPACFTLRREGLTTAKLTVGVSLTGSAENGVDYQSVPAQVVFPAGARTALVSIIPLVDYQVEPDETVTLTLLEGSGYALGGNTAAQVLIRDLREEVSLTVVEPFAMTQEQQAGTFMIQRKGMIARTTTVWLAVGGTATNGVDVERIPTRIAIPAWQTAVYVDVVPKPDAVIAGNSETIVLTVKPDPAGEYTRADPGTGTVTLVQNAAKAVDQNGDGVLDSEDPDFDGLTTAREQEIGSDPLVPTLVLEAGWNMVTVPRNPVGDDTLRSQLGDSFSGIVWGWETDHYIAVVGSALQPGKGYFVFSFKHTVIDLDQTVEGDGQVELANGWNLIGAIRGGNLSAPTGSMVSVYGYTDGAYDPVTDFVLKPMKGYWAHSETAFSLMLP